MRTQLFTLALILSFSKLFAQEYIQILDDNFAVNSMTSLTGVTRNIAEVTLPDHAIGYVYRITVLKNGQASEGDALFDMLKALPIKSISWGSQLARYAINNNDGNAVDVHIFNNPYDANSFLHKNDQNWTSCKWMLNRTNCCFASNDCISKTMYFGFRNNNVSHGVNVHLEVVAIVDKSNSINSEYTYLIANKTDLEIKFQISTEGINWSNVSLRGKYNYTIKRPEQIIYFRMYTTQTNYVTYNITPEFSYYIQFNQQKNAWDLFHD